MAMCLVFRPGSNLDFKFPVMCISEEVGDGLKTWTFVTDGNELDEMTSSWLNPG